ncbi:hypothetical protein ACSV4D_09815 [Flavobacterium sp. ARAG 55.4]|uniref:hypothetical protein n=1 Tax=Flavobacterium sp. ARAG 55.4 TaxID=3451357 RepID=UPI003F459311
MNKIYYLIFCFSLFCPNSYAQVWQWSIPVKGMISDETKQHPQAYLWIPENCKQVKGIVFGQHNMIEEEMLEHAYFRKVMAELGFAEVWVTPVVSWMYNTTRGEDKIITEMFQELANVSGYQEVANAPIVPIGHSAMASFPWNFAAFNPNRTLALVSIHGDAPQTNLTGNGKPNPDWGNHNIDGIPSLFIMGEYEWWEKRIQPAYNYIQKHPKSVITLFADAGHGHFDYSDAMVKYVANYIREAAKRRLTAKNLYTEVPKLKSVKPESGWLMDKWRQDSIPQSKAASFAHFKGDRKTASWVFDKNMAKNTEQFYAKSRGKKMQYIGLIQDGEIVQPDKSHANYALKFKPLQDGISFTLKAFFSDSLRLKPVSDFAKTPLSIDRICGPVKKINDSTFQIRFDKLGFNNSKRSSDIWLLAHNDGDAIYKSAVQQLHLRFPIKNQDDTPQQIDFASINDVAIGIKKIALKAKSSTGTKVSYYVKEGPAYIDDNILHFTKIPPRTHFPIKVTVVAWQYGIAGQLQSADPVERSFWIRK